MSGNEGIRPQSRDSAESEQNGPPPWCEKHKLYYTGSCFECGREVQENKSDAAVVCEQANELHQKAKAGYEELATKSEGFSLTAPDGTLLKPVPFGHEINTILSLGAPSAEEIIEQCLVLARFLTEKNKAYGDSALDPVRILSKADVAEQIRIRMDDKLSRLVRGELAGEDAVQDLVGYYILLKIAEKRGSS